MRIVAYIVAVLSISCTIGGSYNHFFQAVVRNDGGEIQEWVARGFDPNARDPSGQPAILRALQAEAPDAALALARLPGTDVNVRNRVGETPLMMAALKGELAVCQALIERGAEVNPGAGWTPLHYAAAGDALPVVQLLLGQGADVEARAPNGRTPLMLAAQHANEKVVDALLRAGADLGAIDRNQETAADRARAMGRLPLAERLDRRTKTTARP
jgi:ankyrin repeat protein